MSHVIRGFVLERVSSIQYGYRKRGTHAQVFSRTPAHGNSKIEIRQLKIKGKKSRRNECGKKHRGHEKVRQPKRQKSLELVQSLMTVLPPPRPTSFP